MTARALLEADELLPCPFCGGEPKLSYIGNNHTKSRKLTVKCSGCRVQLTHAAIRHDFAWLEDHIARDWNRRDPSLAEQPARAEDKESAYLESLADDPRLDGWCPEARTAQSKDKPA